MWVMGMRAPAARDGSFQLTGQYDAHPAVGFARQNKRFAFAIAAHNGTQLSQQGLQLFRVRPLNKEVEHNSGRKFFITIPWERSGFPQPSCNSVAHATVFLTLL